MHEWEKSGNDRRGFSKEEKNLMLLSPATRLGIKTTGNYYATCMPSLKYYHSISRDGPDVT